MGGGEANGERGCSPWSCSPSQSRLLSPWLGLRPRVAPTRCRPPPGFHLRSSNGYVISAFAGGRPGGPQGMIVNVSKPGSQRLLWGAGQRKRRLDRGESGHGRPGRCSLRRYRRGRNPTLQMRGSRSPFSAGRYEGTIEFAGEDGYSAVDATSATGDARAILNLGLRRPGRRRVRREFPRCAVAGAKRRSRRFCVRGRHQ